MKSLSIERPGSEVGDISGDSIQRGERVKRVTMIKTDIAISLDRFITEGLRRVTTIKIDIAVSPNRSNTDSVTKMYYFPNL